MAPLSPPAKTALPLCLGFRCAGGPMTRRASHTRGAAQESASEEMRRQMRVKGHWTVGQRAPFRELCYATARLGEVTRANGGARLDCEQSTIGSRIARICAASTLRVAIGRESRNGRNARKRSEQRTIEIIL
eukprot:scaffold328_cov248-Pinguiococcus_pyrenoidosus.AAC.11